MNLAKTPMPSEAPAVKMYCFSFLYWCACKIFAKQYNHFHLRFHICLKKIKYTLALSPMGMCQKQYSREVLIMLDKSHIITEVTLLYCSLPQYFQEPFTNHKMNRF